MNKLLVEKGLEKHKDFENKIKTYCDLLKWFDYDESNFYVTLMEVENDNMNSPFHMLEDSIVCIPKQFKDVATKITCNFVCDNIQLFDKDNNVLCRTLGPGYDDICTPLFFID